MNAPMLPQGASLKATPITDMRMRITWPIVALYKEPDEKSDLENQITFGTTVTIDEMLSRDWVRVTSSRDGYEGYVGRASQCMGGALMMPTHRVSVLHAPVRACASLGSAVRTRLFHNSAVCVVHEHAGYSFVEDLGWLKSSELADVLTFEDDPVEVAARYVEEGTPFLMGGLTDSGIDCSGLAQQAYFACGKVLPRNAREQYPALKEHTVDAPERGDLVFFENGRGYICHVALFESPEYVIHANGNIDARRVMREPLEKVASDRKSRPITCRVLPWR